MWIRLARDRPMQGFRTRGATVRAAQDPTGSTSRRQGLRRLPDLLGHVLDRPARQRGLAGSALIDDWPMFVGPPLARNCQPVRLDRRDPPTLHVRVGGAAALEVQHMEPQIIERINQHFGFDAVARLRLVQAPVTRPRLPARPPRRPLSAEAEQAVERVVAAVLDPDLRRALRNLGRAVLPARADAAA